MEKNWCKVKEKGIEAKGGVEKGIYKLLVGAVKIVIQEPGAGGGAGAVDLLHIGRGADLEIVFDEDIVVEDEVTEQDVTICEHGRAE